jgi:hypothetical protein
MLKNPFFTYIISFGSVLFAYQWGWSEIYPVLSYDLLLFLISTFVLSLFFGIYTKKMLDRKMRCDEGEGGLSDRVFLLLVLGFLLDFVYYGGVPLNILIQTGNYNHTEFGIPTLHVAIVTFGGTYSAVKFSNYLNFKNPKFLMQAVIPVIYDILIVNRGAALIAMVSWLSVIIVRRGGLGLKRGFISLALLLGILYLFGILGNARAGVDAIKEIGRPTETFAGSKVPDSFFWTYIYLTSPLANLQETLNKSENNILRFPELIFSEITPDFISKRILPIVGDGERTETPQVDRALNVATIYGRSYVYLGLPGLVIMFMTLAVTILVYVNLIRRSIYRVPALALLNILVVFCVFDNMIAFTGMSLQLLWILLLPNKIMKKTGS